MTFDSKVHILLPFWFNFLINRSDTTFPCSPQFAEINILAREHRICKYLKKLNTFCSFFKFNTLLVYFTTIVYSKYIIVLFLKHLFFLCISVALPKNVSTDSAAVLPIIISFYYLLLYLIESSPSCIHVYSYFLCTKLICLLLKSPLENTGSF